MSDEDNYFHAKDRDLILKAKRDKEREELKKREIKHISEVLGTSPSIAAEVYNLGFDAEAARILHLIPVIQVAWVDGVLQTSEKEKILELAALRDITPERGGPGWAFLELITDRHPDPRFFEETNRVIEAVLKESGQSAGTLLENCKMIAEASGGFLGLRKYTEDEVNLLHEFEVRFKAAEQNSSNK